MYLTENLIRGLDDDEVDFLETVDKTKINAEIKQQRDDAKELEEFRNRVANLQEKEIDDKIQATIALPKPVAKTNTASRPSQKSILKGIVMTKRKAEPETTTSTSAEEPKRKVPAAGPGVQCIGILPGISGEYSATDSENSSDSDEEEDHSLAFDLTGRPLEKHCGGGH